MTEHPLRERLEQLAKRKEAALQPGSDASVQRQHERGKMLARERIESTCLGNEIAFPHARTSSARTAAAPCTHSSRSLS